MLEKARNISYGRWVVFSVAVTFALFAFMAARGDARAQNGILRSTIVVKVNGSIRARNGVEVDLSGGSLEDDVTQTTRGGIAAFGMLPSGTYTVTPSKEGFSYSPSSQDVTVGTLRTLVTLATFTGVEGDLGPDVDVPYMEEWAGSGHADYEAEAFTHWDEDEPPEISTSCARCHSTQGYLDYLGEDGTDFGVVDNAVSVPTDPANAIHCVACHNDTTGELDSVTFPSDVEVTGLGDESRCMLCHQGRSSKSSVDDAITEAAPADDDTVSEDLGFINIHYYAAAATLYGTVAQGGYEYDGKTYDARLNHVEGFTVCIDCHNPHSLEIKIETCSDCHPGVAIAEDLYDVRTNGSLVDYDGDGDMTEGVFYELDGLQEKLLTAIQSYATDVAGKDIAYDEHTYPYFFIDTNGNGVADEDEVTYSNQYDAWTARLLKAAYNYQVSVKDPGAFAHGGKYVIELLYDSIEDLNVALANGAASAQAAVDLSTASRTDEGHFDGSAEAWRHWDEDGEVSSSCAKCHSGDGLAFFIENEVNIAGEIASGMFCSNCHDAIPDFSSLHTQEEVTFPSGLSADLGDDSNLCMNCHSGRESGSSVDDAIAEDPAGPYGFINVHYYPAAASLLGSDAAGGYEYDGKTYAGQSVFTPHGGSLDTCVECHMRSSHNLVPDTGDCSLCHGGPSFTFKGFRTSSTSDYDGDGDTTESRWSELNDLGEALFDEIQAYADALGKPIAYDSHSYPYFFNDLNGNGVADEDEANRDNRYEDLDANLLKAAYNYQVHRKEACGYIHNADYIAQLMVDSIEDLGGDVSAYTWR